MKKTWIVLAALVAGCGGGGGSDNSWLTFSPTPMTATNYEGDSTSIGLDATSTKEIDGNFYVGVIDTSGVFTAQLELAQTDQDTYHATLHTSPTLVAGDYQGKVEVRLCHDDPLVCNNPVDGSPWHIPYHITVQQGSHLTTLTPLPGATSWSTYQGNASHTGAQPGNLDAAKFSRRWSFHFEDVPAMQLTEIGEATQVAIDQGRVFVAQRLTNGHWKMTAISEINGTQLWSTDMGQQTIVDPPAAANGRVYIVSNIRGVASSLWMFDAATGAVLSRRDSSDQYRRRLSPVVYGGYVYAPVGLSPDQGFGKYNATSLQPAWEFSLSIYHDKLSPAVDSHAAYLFDGNALGAFNLSNGNMLWQFQVNPYNSVVFDVDTAPVLDGQGNAYLVEYTIDYPENSLYAVNLETQAIKWQALGHAFNNFFSTPVVANNLLYVVNNSQLEARALDTGEVQWSWASPESMEPSYSQWHSHVVVAGHHAFVTTKTTTYAIDLQTHETVWSYPEVGNLSISANGLLYISTKSQIIAINLH